MKKPTRIEKDIKASSCETEFSCNFFTKESLILLCIAIVFITLDNVYIRYLAWAALLLAFLVPMLKKKKR